MSAQEMSSRAASGRRRVMKVGGITLLSLVLLAASAHVMMMYDRDVQRPAFVACRLGGGAPAHTG